MAVNLHDNYRNGNLCNKVVGHNSLKPEYLDLHGLRSSRGSGYVLGSYHSTCTFALGRCLHIRTIEDQRYFRRENPKPGQTTYRHVEKLRRFTNQQICYEVRYHLSTERLGRLLVLSTLLMGTATQAFTYPTGIESHDPHHRRVSEKQGRHSIHVLNPQQDLDHVRKQY